MAEINFSLGDIFEETFGYRSEAFEPKFAKVAGNSALSPGRKEEGALGASYYANGYNGREYFLPVTVTYPGDRVEDLTMISGDGTTTTGTLPGPDKTWQLPYPVISISSRKTIIETPLTERRGSVKELINITDYEISIKGFTITKKNEFPETDVTTLRELYEQNVAISIKCPLTDIFLLRADRKGSDKVVIKELKFPEVKGIKNVRPYELTLASDCIFNLYEV